MVVATRFIASLLLFGSSTTRLSEAVVELVETTDEGIPFPLYSHL